jgi:hypothetical protein
MTTTRLALATVTLLSAAAFASAAIAAAPAAPAPATPAAPAAPAVTFDTMDANVKTFATFPSAEGTENICQAADGTLYVTLINANKLMKVAPDGKVSEFASVPTAANMLGVGCGSDPEIVAIVFNKTFRGAPNPNPPPANLPANFSDNDVHALVYDAAGKLTADIAIPKGMGINGFDAAGGGIYYGGNSGKAEIVRLDTKAKTATVWFDAKDYGPATGAGIGINGVRFANGWVYFRGLKPGSSPAVIGLYRIQVGADGKPSGAPATLTEGIPIDDFDVAADGSVYLPSGTTLFRVAVDGTRTEIAKPVVGGPSLVVAKDGKSVFWPTRVAGTATMQRLLQVAIP